ncbi:MAG: hypothetical protein U0Q20_09095 [Mycobacterium sp.]
MSGSFDPVVAVPAPSASFFSPDAGGFEVSAEPLSAWLEWTVPEAGPESPPSAHATPCPIPDATPNARRIAARRWAKVLWFPFNAGCLPVRLRRL